MAYLFLLVFSLTTFGASSKLFHPVKFHPKQCACQDERVVNYGNCEAFCSQQTTHGAEILFSTFIPSQVLTRSPLKNLKGLCELSKCVIQAKDSDGFISTLEPLISGPNSLQANVTDLRQDMMYELTLVHLPSRLRSTSIIFLKK